ncbi:hypothetical protein [Paracoccus sp. IB05]|uniref:hypothetical protein n=1 Tax=Paracoccus sp. IB05 TaxID=2779367 RepID=UPI0018E86A4C|nr:hypothetical protein [Paracoccus sp. IB05]MBJ2149460.1 hypothetical protein [Paracoccus sp. IB05]
MRRKTNTINYPNRLPQGQGVVSTLPVRLARRSSRFALLFVPHWGKLGGKAEAGGKMSGNRRRAMTGQL